ncbi:HK97 family phage prohead protease [Gordonia amarae]|uniref:HK97 family phage prohead protease n=1 Tax=Gordonia amarae TaxID=36821 RepID=UPI001AF63699|nr:HK97 family phage prohead protease [Gordonia amarae]QHN18593.1 HK97 family phage prohead protease [Gordonia amarae]QHN19570.1 HK97 family phage prohead protease [Gordonia amarae]
MRVLHKNFELSGLKTAGLADGEFIGWASAYGNIDSQGDRVVKGAFAASVKSIAGGDVVPILWEHKADDPRMQVGQIKTAEETDEGLRVHVALDLDTETGAAAYKSVKSRRVKALSIGYGVRKATKAADGAQELTDLDLVEVSLVARPANDRATITASKSADGTSSIVAARRALAGLKADDSADTTSEEESPLANTEQTWGERVLAYLEQSMAAAQELIDSAETEGRDLDDAEVAAVEKALDRAHWMKREAAEWAEMTPDLRHGFQFHHDVISGGMKSEEFSRRWGSSNAPAKALHTFSVPDHLRDVIGLPHHTKTGQEALPMNETKYLTLGSGRKAAASTIAAKMTGRGGTYHEKVHGADLGAKALTTAGQVTTDIPVAPTVVVTGRPAVSLLDVIPTERRTGPTYRYLRQNSRALSAAAVASGAVKPTSSLGTETVDNTVSVVAHLSEPIDKFVLEDAAQLQRFVADEMLYGLDVAISAQVLSGNGTAPNQRGILNTSGVQVTPFVSNVLVSIRKAITSQESLGYSPSVLVISPQDWETLELLAATDAALSYRGVPLDQGERKIWGLRAVLDVTLPAKTALVLDPAAVSIDTVGGIDVEWTSEAGELFSRNQVQARVETRIGVSVYQPSAIVKVGTAAA